MSSFFRADSEERVRRGIAALHSPPPRKLASGLRRAVVSRALQFAGMKAWLMAGLMWLALFGSFFYWEGLGTFYRLAISLAPHDSIGTVTAVGKTNAIVRWGYVYKVCFTFSDTNDRPTEAFNYVIAFLGGPSGFEPPSSVNVRYCRFYPKWAVFTGGSPTFPRERSIVYDVVLIILVAVSYKSFIRPQRKILKMIRAGILTTASVEDPETIPWLGHHPKLALSFTTTDGARMTADFAASGALERNLLRCAATGRKVLILYLPQDPTIAYPLDFADSHAPLPPQGQT